MLRRSSCVIILALLAGCPSAHAQQTDLNAPTLVLVNGKILTMDGQSRTAEAVAIRDGKFLAIGDSPTIRSMAGSGTRTIDLAGKTVVPGLIDTHAHFKAAGLADYVVNMSRAKTIAEAFEAIKQFAAKKQPGDWIVGRRLASAVPVRGEALSHQTGNRQRRPEQSRLSAHGRAFLDGEQPGAAEGRSGQEHAESERRIVSKGTHRGS